MEFSDGNKNIEIKLPSTEKYVPVLIDIIKIIYGDKSDLVIPNISASSKDIALHPETEKETEGNVKPNVKINVNKPIEPEKTKEETKPKTGNFNTLFSDENKLTKPGEYGSVALYKPILNFILENTNDTFTKKDILDSLQKFYKQKAWPMKESTARIYETQYRKYMLDKGIIQPKGYESFTKIKKKPSIKNIQ